MTDTRALREDEREAMLEACDAYSPQCVDHGADLQHHVQTERNAFFKGFIAGLRYRDEAEPSEAEVEAAILAAYNDQPQWFGGTMTRPSDRRPKTFEECYGCAPLEHAESRRDVELILEAARKASP